MDCEANEELTARVELKVNGEAVELNNFVQNIISRTIVGMVGSLKGVDQVETVDLSISRKMT
jgi:hypothetical protein